VAVQDLDPMIDACFFGVDCHTTADCGVAANLGCVIWIHQSGMLFEILGYSSPAVID